MKKITLLTVLLLAGLVFSACSGLFDNNNGTSFTYLTKAPQESFSYSASQLDDYLDNSPYNSYFGTDVTSKTEYWAQGYLISYKTTYKGVPITASGVIILPKAYGSVTPPAMDLISYQHGTKFANTERPSSLVNISAQNIDQELGLCYVLGSCGFAVFLADYIGFGESYNIIHPYYIYEPTVQCLKDGLLAAQEALTHIGASTTGKLHLMGYSEGGYATIALLKELQTNPPTGLNFTLTKVAAGAGAYDITETARLIFQTNEMAYQAYPPYIFTAFNNHYGWNRDYADIYTPGYYASLDWEDIYGGSYTGDTINSTYVTDTDPDNVFNTTFQSNFLLGGVETEIETAFDDNSLVNDLWSPGVLTMLYHSQQDATVPFVNTVNLSNCFYNHGGSGNFDVVDLTAPNHGEGALEFATEALVWLYGP